MRRLHHGLASLNLSLHNQGRPGRLLHNSIITNSRITSADSLERLEQQARTIHDLDVYGGGLNANVVWAL